MTLMAQTRPSPASRPCRPPPSNRGRFTGPGRTGTSRGPRGRLGEIIRFRGRPRSRHRRGFRAVVVGGRTVGSASGQPPLLGKGNRRHATRTHRSSQTAAGRSPIMTAPAEFRLNNARNTLQNRIDHTVLSSKANPFGSNASPSVGVYLFVAWCMPRVLARRMPLSTAVAPHRESRSHAHSSFMRWALRA